VTSLKTLLFFFFAIAFLFLFDFAGAFAQNFDARDQAIFPRVPWPVPSATLPQRTEPTETPENQSNNGVGSDLKTIEGLKLPSVSPAQRRARAKTNRSGAVPTVQPFGANLFDVGFGADQQESLNPNYEIAPGDRVSVQLWGAFSFNGTPTVDAQGNIFVPQVGPIRISGIKNRDLNRAVVARIRSVFSDNVMVYTNLLSTQPVAVYVSGFVERPGRYSGKPSDSLLYFIDRAGGVNHLQGSFRSIRVIRNGRLLARADLYDFLLDGILPKVRFEDGDTIVVESRRFYITVDGAVRNRAAFELHQQTISGTELMELAAPNVGASHVALSGVRDGRVIVEYLPMRDFPLMVVHNGDHLKFIADTKGSKIFVNIVGQYRGPGIFSVRNGTKLSDLLNLVEVNSATAQTSAIYIRRRSVAEAQMRSIKNSLRRLEKSVLTAQAVTSGVAQIRQTEAKLVSDFVQRAEKVVPEGRVVLTGGKYLSDIMLEADDVIVIPHRSDVVQIHGEVSVPQSVVLQSGDDLEKLVQMAGGYSNRANKDRVLLIRQSGTVLDAQKVQIQPGDQIIVMPEIEIKSFEIGKEMLQIIFQIATSAAVMLSL